MAFKKTREAAQAINGWKVKRSITFLENVINHQEAVPMRRYAGSTGRTAQGEWAVYLLEHQCVSGLASKRLGSNIAKTSANLSQENRSVSAEPAGPRSLPAFY